MPAEPVAVASLMTAAAMAPLATQGTPEYLGAAIVLATITGLILLAMGLLRLGFLANFLSHPVISGFITAASIQIAAGQLGPVLGVEDVLDDQGVDAHEAAELFHGPARKAVDVDPVDDVGIDQGGELVDVLGHAHEGGIQVV